MIRKNEEPEAEEQKEEERPEKKGRSESEELKDRLMRLAAEFDNYKKRTARELDGSKMHGEAIVIGKLLPTLDEFELAMKTLDKNDEKLKGIAMIYANFVSTLRGLGLKEIDADGVYDPHRHDVILSRESEKAEGTIIEIVRKGYMLNDMMLRPASVIVAKPLKTSEEVERHE